MGTTMFAYTSSGHDLRPRQNEIRPRRARGGGRVSRYVFVEISRVAGQLYTRDRYVWRGRYAASRFERNCLCRDFR